MTTKNMTPRTIILSEETAELFAAKKALDECFYTVNSSATTESLRASFMTFLLK